jgi:hypothetical protein
MSWLDKLLGREKKPADETTGDSSITTGGMGEAEAAPSADMPPQPEQPAQEEEQPPPGTP